MEKQLQIKDGWLVNERRVLSPHFDQRPEPKEISLLIIHYISLPPEQFGGQVYLVLTGGINAMILLLALSWKAVMNSRLLMHNIWYYKHLRRKLCGHIRILPKSVLWVIAMCRRGGKLIRDNISIGNGIYRIFKLNNK